MSYSLKIFISFVAGAACTIVFPGILGIIMAVCIGGFIGCL